jgi:N-acetylated-alpha-linked acidic dipeptidase
VGDLGSGSDYTPFVQHLGIASVNLGFGGEGQSGGVYHSAYDTFEHFARFGDPGFVYGVVLARTTGRLVLRAADAELLPFRFGNLAETVAREVGELKQLVVSRRDHARLVDRLLDTNAFAVAADPTSPSGSPERESLPPELDFSVLDAAVERLRTSAQAYDAAMTAPAAADRAGRANLILQGLEQALTQPEGLPGRPWYRHLIYAPGVLTGYGAKTLPGVREAIEGGAWERARDFIGRTAQVLNAASAKIDEATRALSG